ncbi:hypothetical protein VB776_06980 [Arcicella sp. DC2W]|uniref:Uncharacterized protein n=1 Tax=Arcicella gelida TaxID=2984195 RepID=A0ABU5S2G7_9BACT|nr:hypothetical protein [Arcicella sp. DC2W]MEA5402651.1 hypothetical protein [Arcicella sp. DC2W]
MAKISEYVDVNEIDRTVHFFGREDWIEVDDLNAWISAFWDEARDIAMSINGSSEIERIAFDRIT